jgi:peptide/nickel transport system substrate-binding protein
MLALRLSLSATLALSLGVSAAPAQTVLRVVPHSDLKILDPIQTTARISVNHGNMVFETLYAWDQDLNVRPQMVESATTTADKLTVTMTLRSGLRWHDGTAVTARDVVPSLNRWMVRDVAGQKLKEFVADLSAVDDRSFRFVLKEPVGWLEFALGASAGTVPFIMQARHAATDPFKAVTEMVGSGPFKFVAPEWRPGTKVVWQKNTDYVPRPEPPNGLAGGRVAHVDRVEWIVIPDAATAANALIAGEIDLIDGPSADMLPVLERNPNVVLRALDKGAYGIVRPNHLHPPFNNVKARQALALAVDQRDYLRAAYGEKNTETCWSYFFCGTPYGTEVGSDAFRKADPEKARRLLAESGYKGETIVVLHAADNTVIGAIAQVAADGLRKIGANVELKSVDWNSVLTLRGKKDLPTAGGWSIFTTTASNSLMFHPLINFATNTECGGRNWFGWACDEEADRLRTHFLRQTDEGEKKKAIEALHRRLWEVVPSVLTGQAASPMAWRKNVEGVLAAPVLLFYNVRKT